MLRGGVSPRRFSRIVLVAGLFLALIVLSGAAVRLTEAGLGCEDWPTCNEDQLTPEWELHGWIEFGNRLISGVVALACVAVALAAHRRVPRRADLILWSWGLVLGVAVQVVLGGITVLADLHPLIVSLHFLLSMVLLWNAIVLWVKSRARSEPQPDPEPLPTVAPRQSIAWHSRGLIALATLVLITGTFVTGTGPNSGDWRADRLRFDLTDITRVHSVFVWLLVATLVALAVRLTRNGDPAAPIARALLVVAVAQGAVGYTQFALGVPPALVEVHILGAVTVWCLAILLHLRLWYPVSASAVVESPLGVVVGVEPMQHLLDR